VRASFACKRAGKNKKVGAQRQVFFIMQVPPLWDHLVIPFLRQARIKSHQNRLNVKI